MNRMGETSLLFLAMLAGAFLPSLAGCKDSLHGDSLYSRALTIMGQGSNFRVRVMEWSGVRGLFFFDDESVARMYMEIFPDNENSNIVMSQRKIGDNPKLMFRTDHSNQNVMLFLKNEADQHRIDMGIDIDGPDENAYLVYWNGDGKKQTLFGSFPYIGDQSIRKRIDQ